MQYTNAVHSLAIIGDDGDDGSQITTYTDHHNV